MKIAASRPLKCGSGIIFFIILVHSSSSCPRKKEKKKGKKHPISLFALLNTSSLTFTLGVHMIYCPFHQESEKVRGRYSQISTTASNHLPSSLPTTILSSLQSLQVNFPCSYPKPVSLRGPYLFTS